MIEVTRRDADVLMIQERWRRERGLGSFKTLARAGGWHGVWRPAGETDKGAPYVWGSLHARQDWKAYLKRGMCRGCPYGRCCYILEQEGLV